MIKKIIIFLFLALNIPQVYSQNFLDGVYFKQKHGVRNVDTLSTVLKVTVIDKETQLPMQDILVEYFSSVGESYGARTDEKGVYVYYNLHHFKEYKGKVVINGGYDDLSYESLMWEFNTNGLSEPKKFEVTFELEKRF